MKLAIFGATGGTGKLLVEQALAAGHQIVAFVRSPSKLTTRHEGLTVLVGEITDFAAVESAVQGVEAVISVLGPRGRDRSKPITRGTQNIIAAMKAHGVRRLVISSTPSAVDPNDRPDWRFKLAIGLIRHALPSAYADIIHTAQVVRASDCDWTIVRASMLTNAPKVGMVKVGYADKAMGMWLSRANFAGFFLLQQVQDTEYLREAPVISNG